MLEASADIRDTRHSMLLGAKLKCPNCNQGKLFQSYLKPVLVCNACDEDLSHQRADDGPAYITILIVAHIIGFALHFVCANFSPTPLLLLPQYGTSRLLERMVKAGLIERLECDDDGRGQIVRISDKGRSVRNAMWPIYAHVLSEEIGAKLTTEEAAQLVRLLSKL